MLCPLPDDEASWSDELQEYDAASRVAARFRRSGFPLLRAIKCELRDGVLVLSGAVPTYHLKQVAQSLALHTAGIRQIEDRVIVTSAGHRGRIHQPPTDA
jgi:hypothetical protein